MDPVFSNCDFFFCLVFVLNCSVSDITNSYSLNSFYQITQLHFGTEHPLFLLSNQFFIDKFMSSFFSRIYPVYSEVILITLKRLFSALKNFK